MTVNECICFFFHKNPSIYKIFVCHGSVLRRIITSWSRIPVKTIFRKRNSNSHRCLVFSFRFFLDFLFNWLLIFSTSYCTTISHINFRISSGSLSNLITAGGALALLLAVLATRHQTIWTFQIYKR